ncbi:MAG: DUF4432 family protein [Chloroflexi bacterium]|nr:DUF4432 family protein [Chloroflexota bacterium]
MIREGRLRGHRTFVLANDWIEVVVLPDRGAEIHQIRHMPTGTTVLLETPFGLPALSADTRADFLDGYAGGWQELFPNVNEACVVDGVALPFHGEATLAPWDAGVTGTGPDSSLVLTYRSPGLGVRLERQMRLRPDAAGLELVETVTNERAAPVRVAWGHHIVLGGTFLKAGCRIDLAGGWITTPRESYEPESARLAAGQRESWPIARGRNGQDVDLRIVPGPDDHSHDDIFVVDLPEGRVVVSDPATGLTVRLDWAVDVFGCLVNWRPLGGADLPPLTGIYGLGIEPWTSPDDLARATARGDGFVVEPGAPRTTRLTFGIDHPRPTAETERC